MTYCLSINTHDGLVLAATSDVNPAHNILASNIHRFTWSGDRAIFLLSSGNASTIEAVVNQIKQDVAQNNGIHLRNIATMNEATDYIAGISVAKQKIFEKRNKLTNQYKATFILAGQISNQAIETFLIYTQGNFIHESNRLPFLQIGEIKYGKPILDRMINREISLNNAARCALVSIDSVFQSKPHANGAVELLIYKYNSLEESVYQVFEHDNALLKNISQSWSYGITAALDHLPNFSWEA